MQVLTITATDAVGNVTVKTVNYRVLDAINTRRHRRRHRAAPRWPDAGYAAPRSARSRRASTRTTRAATTANVISTAGDATLSVADPSSTNTGKLMNGTFTLPSRCRSWPPAPAAPARRSRRSAAPPLPTTLLTYSAPTVQRRGDDDVQADDRPHRGAPYGPLQQDPDVHAVHDHSVDSSTATRAAARRSAGPAAVLGDEPCRARRQLGQRLRGSARRSSASVRRPR